jgi:hypothetical protein
MPAMKGKFLALSVGEEVLVVHEVDVALMRALNNDDVAFRQALSRMNETSHLSLLYQRDNRLTHFLNKVRIFGCKPLLHSKWTACRGATQ